MMLVLTGSVVSRRFHDSMLLLSQVSDPSLPFHERILQTAQAKKQEWDHLVSKYMYVCVCMHACMYLCIFICSHAVV